MTEDCVVEHHLVTSYASVFSFCLCHIVVITLTLDSIQGELVKY